MSNETKHLEVAANIRHPERGFLFYISDADGNVTDSVLVKEDEAVKTAKLILKAACVNFSTSDDDEDALWS